MVKYAIIVAAGAGTRMGSPLPKQFIHLKGKPLLWHTIRAFIKAYDDIQVILVLPVSYQDQGSELAKEFPYNRMHIVPGGETRFHSVRNGLRLVDHHSIVFIHDGVRCLVTVPLIRRCAEAAIEKGNAIPAVRATDTIRLVTPTGNTLLDRDMIRIIQTPQTFLSQVIKKAFEEAGDGTFTDEASVVEKAGIPAHLVEGERNNIKITTPFDLLLAEKILDEREQSEVE